jgi:hypothetical protein
MTPKAFHALIENLDDDLHALIELAKGVQARNDPAEIASFLENNRAGSIQEYIAMLDQKRTAAQRSAALDRAALGGDTY